MGRPKGWASDQTGRAVMRSPGRPPVGRREHRQQFWAAVARGATSLGAAAEALVVYGSSGRRVMTSLVAAGFSAVAKSMSHENVRNVTA
jgi:hypothetical protein